MIFLLFGIILTTTGPEKQADNYYKLLLNACTELAKKPKMGKDYSEIYPELKGQRTSTHIIFYREIDHNTINAKAVANLGRIIKNVLPMD